MNIKNALLLLLITITAGFAVNSHFKITRACVDKQPGDTVIIPGSLPFIAKQPFICPGSDKEHPEMYKSKATWGQLFGQ